jgi:hypothetical protein
VLRQCPLALCAQRLMRAQFNEHRAHELGERSRLPLFDWWARPGAR